MRILAIDPGPEESALVWYESKAARPVGWAKMENDEALGSIDTSGAMLMAIEMVASYGMPVGASVFETCVWAGRFIERWIRLHGVVPRRVYRKDAKLHLCGSARAKDSNVRQALIDRYGPSKEEAIGRKASPGPLYGMKADCWAALAVAITAAETQLEERVSHG